MPALVAPPASLPPAPVSLPPFDAMLAAGLGGDGFASAADPMLPIDARALLLDVAVSGGASAAPSQLAPIAYHYGSKDRYRLGAYSGPASRMGGAAIDHSAAQFEARIHAHDTIAPVLVIARDSYRPRGFTGQIRYRFDGQGESGALTLSGDIGYLVRYLERQ